MKKPKKVPVLIGDRTICHVPNDTSVHAIYNKWCFIYNIRKIYHPLTPTERYVVETHRKRGWEDSGI